MKKRFNIWMECLVGFVVSGLLLLYSICNYDSLVYDKGGSTGDQLLRRLYRVLDSNFSSDGVFIFFSVFMLLFGVCGIVGYLKSKKN